jgi:hypothetical protein
VETPQSNLITASRGLGSGTKQGSITYCRKPAIIALVLSVGKKIMDKMSRNYFIWAAAKSALTGFCAMAYNSLEKDADVDALAHDALMAAESLVKQFEAKYGPIEPKN